MRNHIVLLLLLFSLLPVCASAESLSLAEMAAAEDAASLSSDLSAPETVQTVSTAAREDFIDRILSLAQTLYTKANGQPQRAQYSGDIYICKNYTVHLFRETCGDFRMAEYPDVPLIIPNNPDARIEALPGPPTELRVAYLAIETNNFPAGVAARKAPKIIK